MKIAVKLAFDERAALRLLNWLAQENAHLLRAHPDLPLLYDSGVVYRRETDETDETWCDYLNMLAQGHEDCNGLAAARAGELIAKGIGALRPGDAGYEDARRASPATARRAAPATIHAEMVLTARSTPDQPGLYHCIVRYRVGGRWHRDDPSARLGMNGGRIDPLVKARWAELLFTFCKSDLFKSMVSRCATASMYPAVTDGDVLQTPALLPEGELAEGIVSRVSEALRKIEEARADLSQAIGMMNDFHVQALGEEG